MKDELLLSGAGLDFETLVVIGVFVFQDENILWFGASVAAAAACVLDGQKLVLNSS
jgi:hypothetical protein